VIMRPLESNIFRVLGVFVGAVVAADRSKSL
jgi:hypothetical protein